MQTHTDFAANLAFFLQDKTGSIFGHWSGRMSAKDQRALMGQFLGKGTLVIDGNDETIKMVVSACFGQDTVISARATWAELVQGVDALAIYVRDGKRCRG
jgi:hypothetical protein